MAKERKKSHRASPYSMPTIGAVKVMTDRDGFFYGVNDDGSIAWKEDKSRPPEAKGNRHAHHVTEDFTVFDKDGHPITLPYSPAILKHHQRFWPYMEEIALEICRRITEGDSVKKICSSKGMPPAYILHKWRVEVPGFKAMVEEAKKFRAENFHDKIMEEVEWVDEQNAKSSKVRIDAYKHLAAVGDPDTYGNKTKISGDINQPLSFVFNTGISREEAPAIPTEGNTLNEAIEGPTEDDNDGL